MAADSLIEAVARAMWERRTKEQYDEPIIWEQLAAPYRALSAKDARAAIAAIEASGTHRVVPVTSSEKMRSEGAIALAKFRKEEWGDNAVVLFVYENMLAAAPKVTP